MKELTTKVYYCDHCRKYGLSKSNIKKHEQFCFGNPENVPRCFEGCVHLSSESGPEGGKHYHCNKLSKGLFTKKAMVLGKTKSHIYDNALLMPNNCGFFEEEERRFLDYTGSGLSELFDF